MSDLSGSIGFDDPLDLSSTDVVNDQSESFFNQSINGTGEPFGSSASNETMRLLFLAIATITILICLTICISVCVCICFNRRRNSKRHEKQDHFLLPEQSEQISTKRTPVTNSISSNGKQHATVSIPQSSSNIIFGKPSINSYYYDNLDDIPFIDESRPTSYIDITRV